MIKEIADVKLDDGSILCRHTIEVYCPSCSRDVDEAELTAQKCKVCGCIIKAKITLESSSCPLKKW